MSLFRVPVFKGGKEKSEYKELIKGLQHPESLLEVQKALVEIGEPAVPFLIKAFKDEASSLAAVNVLKEIGAPGIHHLVDALKDKEVSSYAAMVLEGIGHTSVEPLLEALIIPDRRVQILAIRSLGKLGRKVCYVCLNKPYKDVMEDLTEQEVDVKNFFFIDVLSSYYKKQHPVDNCVFISAPTDTVSILDALMKAIKEKKCEIIVFDTISTLLIYRQPHLILKFVHKILEKKMKSGSNKVLITLKGGRLMNYERDELIKDVIMFADNSITVEKKHLISKKDQ